jgi:hypothetical protein
MLKHATPAAAILAASVSFGPIALTGPEHPRMTVHEWGTFTSVAGEDGQPIRWLPLAGSSDLPCFVEQARSRALKGTLVGTVRMETPVLYFYTPAETSVDVDVRFRDGVITEYFPPAEVDGGSITWRHVSIAADAFGDFPVAEAPSHYYAARQTDAAPLQVDSQTERFLFYRGVGSFPLPLSAIVNAQDDVAVTNIGHDRVENVVLFENRAGRVGYRIGDLVDGSTTLPRPTLDGNLTALRSDLESILMAHGLFPREAVAMVETWRDSWFEEGIRLLYVVPQKTIRSILPLRITPRPADIVRVFIGRLELVSPATLNDVRTAIASGDWSALEKYGRFLMPIGDRLLAGQMPPATRALIRQRLQAASSSFDQRGSACAR